MDTTHLIEQLAGGAPLERIEAAIALEAATDAPGAVGALLAATRDPLWQVREAAIASLTGCVEHAPEVGPRAIELALDDVSVWTRATARAVVERATGRDDVRARLRAVAIDVDRPTPARMRALRLLAPLLHPAADCDATVQALMTEHDWTLRVAAIETCVERGLTGCVAAIGARLRDDGDDSVRVAALDALVALGRTPDHATRLALAGSDQPPAMRRAAADALGMGPGCPDQVVDTLVAMLEATEAVVVSAALGALERLAPPAGEALVDAVLGCLIHTSDMVVIAAQEALVAIGRQDPGLLDLLQRGPHSRGVRIGVTRVLLRLSFERADTASRSRPLLLDFAVSDPSRAVRESATRALVRGHRASDLLALLAERLEAATRRSQRTCVYTVLRLLLEQQHAALDGELLGWLLRDLESDTATMRLSATALTNVVPPPTDAPAAAPEAPTIDALLPLVIRRAFEGELHVSRTARDGLGDRFARWLPEGLATTVTTPGQVELLDARRLVEAPLDDVVHLPSDATLGMLIGAAPEVSDRVLSAWRGHAHWWQSIAEHRRPQHRDDLARLRHQVDTLDDPHHLARAAARIAALARPTLAEGAPDRSQRLHHRLLHGVVREHAWQMSRLLSSAHA